MRDLLLILSVGICSLVAIRRPLVGILGFTCLGFLNPQSMTWGVAQRIPFSQIVAVCTIAGYVLAEEDKKFSIQREGLLMLMLWALFIFTTAFAREPEPALQKLIHTSKIFLMIFMTVFIINSPFRLKALLYVIVLSLGFYGFKGGLFALQTRGSLMVFGPENSFLEANNAIGMALSMNIPLLFFLFRHEARRWLRALMALTLVFSIPAIICTFSRGAWLGLVIASALSIWKSRHRFVMALFLCVIGTVFILLNPQIFSSRIKNRYDDLRNYKQEVSAVSRFWNWECCRRVGFANPITGAGFDYYSFDMYHDYYPEFLQKFPGKLWSCHNAFLTVFAEHGPAGFLLWSGLLLSTIFSLRHIKTTSREIDDLNWMADLSEMIRISLFAFFITGIFLDTAYFDMLYYLIAIVVIMKNQLAQIVPENSSSLAHQRAPA